MHFAAGDGRRQARPPRHSRLRSVAGAEPAAHRGRPAARSGHRSHPLAAPRAVAGRRCPGVFRPGAPAPGAPVRHHPHAYLEGGSPRTSGRGDRLADARRPPAARTPVLRLLRASRLATGGSGGAAPVAAGRAPDRPVVAGGRGASGPGRRPPGAVHGGPVGYRPASVPPGPGPARRLSRPARPASGRVRGGPPGAAGDPARLLAASAAAGCGPPAGYQPV